MSTNIPTLSSIVDLLTVRAEYAKAEGLMDEAIALCAARERIVSYVFWEERSLSLWGERNLPIIKSILSRADNQSEPKES